MPPAKRRKIDTACETCRLRKSRCDGGRPKCSACLKRRNVGPVCVYVPSPYSAPTTNTEGTHNTIISHDDRVAEYTATNEPDSLLETSRHLQPISANQSANAVNSGALEITRTQSDALETGKDVENDWILRAGLLAASSSAKFFKTVFGNSERDEPAADHVEEAQNQAVPGSSFHVPTGSLFDLPQRKLADTLLDKFWTYVYIKWLNKDDFMTWYQDLWTENATATDPVDEKIRYATLNMILALVYRTEPDFEEDQDRMAQKHFSRAKELLQVGILEYDRMSLLYALFLLLQWYQSTNDIKSCRSLIKSCLLIASNLGIDDMDKVANLKSQREREMARRGWHGCILMDRIIAMVSGSPPQVSQAIAKAAPLFENIDDQYLTTTGSVGCQPRGRFSKQAFFVHFCKLHLILGDLLISQTHDINRIIEIDKELHDFDEGLPQELRYDLTNDSTLGQAVHLRTRFLYIKILLYRSCFTQATNLHQSTFHAAIIHLGLERCIDAAQVLLKLLDARHAVGDRRPGMIPQWWHTIGYVYSASTVVIAAHLFPNMSQDRRDIQLETSIQQGFRILDSYKRYRDQAQRCRRALTALYNRYVGFEQGNSTLDQGDETIELAWTWEGLPELFDDIGMFDCGFSEL